MFKRMATGAMGAMIATSLVIAGCSTGGSSSKSLTGTEVIEGSSASTAVNVTFPLTAAGLFSDKGTFTLRGNDNRKAGTDSVPLGKGSIRFYHAGARNGSTTTSPNCSIRFSQGGTVRAMSGTGAYKGITGHGTFLVAFTGMLPMLRGHVCNYQATPFGQAETFVVKGVFILP